jgi:hypothetical protein
MKKILFIVFGIGLTANLYAQVPSYVPTNGLVGWWPFNGNANDESGNGNNGTVNGATLTTDRFGVANKAYSFAGINDNILIQNIGTNSNWSLNFWFETPISNNLYLEYLFGLGSYLNPLCNCTPGFGISGINQQQPCPSILPDKVIFVDTVFSTCNVTYISNYSVSTIYHYVISKSNLNYTIYQNGQLIWSGIGANINLDRLLAGKRFSNDLDFNGKIDDIGIWNRALSECEIQDLYNSQINSVASSISVFPNSASIGANVTLSTASSSANVQWQTNGVNLGWQNVPSNSTYNGGISNTLTVSNVQLANHNQPFRVIASSGNCVDTSNIATIQIADTCITNVTVYDTLLTTVTDTLIINTTLSLPAPNNENTILIYPNPASDHITIDNGNFAAMAGYSIKIENNAGQQVFQSVINQQQFYVDLSTWTGNGLYFVHLIDPQNNTVTVRKIVLQ